MKRAGFEKYVNVISKIGIYGLATLLVPLMVAVLLLIFTRGRLSYKIDRTGKQIEVPQPTLAQ